MNSYKVENIIACIETLLTEAEDAEGNLKDSSALGEAQYYFLHSQLAAWNVLKRFPNLATSYK